MFSPSFSQTDVVLRQVSSSELMVSWEAVEYGSPVKYEVQSRLALPGQDFSQVL